MANVQGRRQYDTRSNRIVQNVLPNILLVDPDINEAAFLTFYNKLGVMRTPQEQFKWDVDDHIDTNDTLDGAVTAIATSIKVDTPALFISNQLWQNKRTGEIIRVRDTNTSTGYITADRAVTALNSSGGTAAAAMVDADILIRIGNAVGENSRRQATLTTTPSEVSNYTQIFRYDLSMSRRQLKREFENGDELPYQQRKHLDEARKDLNAAFIAGEKARFTDDSGNDVTTTQGIKGVPSTYTWSVGGTLYEYEWDSFLIDEGLRRGSRNKVLIASNAVILAISEMTKDRVSYDLPLSKKSGSAGIKVMEYMAPNGGLMMVVEDRFLSDNFNGTAVGIDMSQLKRRVFSNNGIDDNLHIISNTEDPDDVGTVTTLYGDEGLEYGVEQTHFLITNVCGGSKGRAIE